MRKRDTKYARGMLAIETVILYKKEKKLCGNVYAVKKKIWIQQRTV